MNKLNIIQWNSQSAVAKRINLEYIIKKYQAHVIVLCETWYKPLQQISFKYYNVVRNDRADGYAGVAILIHKAIEFQMVHINQQNVPNNLMMCGIKLTHYNFTIVSVYRTVEYNCSYDEYFNVFSELPSPLMICGDFNAHHPTFGSAKCNNAGNILIKVLDSLNFTFLNDGSPTRVSRPGESKSAVDLTICTPALANRAEWSVLEDAYTSDHFPILISMGYEGTNTNLIYPKLRWKINNENLTLFTNYLDNKDVPSPSFESINEKIDSFIETISEAANSVFKINQPFSIKKKNVPPWWDKECTTIINKRKSALNDFRRSQTLEKFIKYQEIMSYSKRFLKYKKRESWKNLCNSITQDMPITDIWTNVKKFNRTWRAKKVISKDTLNSILYKLTPDFASSEPLRQPNGSADHCILHPFSIKEFNTVLNNIKDTTPGFDDINYSMLKHLPTKFKNYLVQIYNDMWEKKEQAESLKNIVIIPILKPNKNPDLTDSYRPIALSSCILKTFERMIKDRLEWWLESTKILPEAQYGFRKQRGTIDALTDLVTELQLTLSQNKTTCCMFLDIKNAYGCVDLNILQRKMIKIGLPERAAECITNLFRDNKIFVRTHTNEKVGPRRLPQGLLQGSSLSPILFNIYTQDIHRILAPHVNLIQYADDICLYVSSRVIMDLSSIMSMAVDKLNNWLKKML